MRKSKAPPSRNEREKDGVPFSLRICSEKSTSGKPYAALKRRASTVGAAFGAAEAALFQSLG